MFSVRSLDISEGEPTELTELTRQLVGLALKWKWVLPG